MIIIPHGIGYDKKEVNGSLEMLQSSYINIPNHWIHNKYFSDSYELIFVTSGMIHLSVNETFFDICENEYLICPAFSHIKGTKRSEGPCSFFSIRFNITPEVLDYPKVEKKTLTGNLLFINDLLRRINLLSSLHYDERLEGEGLLLSLLIELQSMETKSKQNESNLVLQNVLNYISENVQETLDVNSLCARFNYSPDYISKRFREAYGISIKAYINRVKMTVAKQLLTTSHFSIEQVGKSVGFPSVQLFYKFFRYHETITPTEYRKRFR